MIKDIDKKTYKINDLQFYPEKIRKEKIIIGHSSSPDMKFARWVVNQRRW